MYGKRVTLLRKNLTCTFDALLRSDFESALISERVKAGMQRAKEEGKHVGRPPIPEDTQAKVRQLYTEEDVSINQIAERLDIAYGTAWNYVQKVKND